MQEEDKNTEIQFREIRQGGMLSRKLLYKALQEIGDHLPDKEDIIEKNLLTGLEDLRAPVDPPGSTEIKVNLLTEEVRFVLGVSENIQEFVMITEHVK